MDTQSVPALVDTLLRALGGGSSASRPYYESALPAPRDAEIRAALGALASLDEAGRRAFFERISGDWEGGMLDTFVMRAAMLAARNRDRTWLQAALAALPYSAEPRDPEGRRSLLASLAAAWRSATLIGLDERAFQSALSPAPIPEVAAVIAKFMAMSASDRAPESHNLREVRGKRGVMWLVWASPPPKNW